MDAISLDSSGSRTANTDAMRDTLAFQKEVTAWASATFPGQTPKSKADHLLDEAGELNDDPSDGEEMADILILLLNLAEMHRLDLFAEAEKKMKKNRARTWGKPDARGVVRHTAEGA